MWIDDDVCYQALSARDARFDGHFFVAVSSTGIYCRPVCPAAVPKRVNCRFYSSAAAAEGAGFRPCLRCRPELAPGHASVDARHRLAQAAAARLDDGAAEATSVADLAMQLGVTDRHLRRVFSAEFGVTPIAYAQTQRLLLAKRLLTDTALPVTEVALTSGFQSVRRFNALFRERYRMAPGDVRRHGRRPPAGELVFQLAYRPPLAWPLLRDFLGQRAIAGVEAVDTSDGPDPASGPGSGQGRGQGEYRRTVAIRRGEQLFLGWLTVAPVAGRDTLKATLSGSLAAVVPEVLARLKRLFDLACQPDRVAAALGEVAQAHPGLRVPGAFDGFEAAVRAVLGQQITVRAARTLAGRFAAELGTPLHTPFAELTHAFPDAATVANADPARIGKLGILRRRVAAIQALAEALVERRLQLTPGADVDATLAALKALPGIGDWTAQYLAMRALSWPDAFPAADFGVLKALGERSPAAARQRAEAWRPWRAYAVLHLWQSLADQQKES
ncbi:DNA-3-methyladenine glycosylase 2 family protein [Alloalcanivorax mobilis]|uniref:DNA-3-methyladenine glycosylase 2 family protein n=1 Tax=Alloalcanivorax mobilis TaxID=2019569 RepID=UPI000B5B2B5A|nr:Ada metal-binding domain-containing protein [Alloalcanivorax mobilis]ASK36148.1 adenosine deaminase [Alcanivorax sp. N3-2A]|tara:strand:+ start:9959 stop:11461 length:1503 start_codon:yes stop_codon:yes gene_type:complete